MSTAADIEYVGNHPLVDRILDALDLTAESNGPDEGDVRSYASVDALAYQVGTTTSAVRHAIYRLRDIGLVRVTKDIYGTRLWVSGEA